MQDADERHRHHNDFVSSHQYRGPSNSRQEYHQIPSQVANLAPVKPSRHVTFSQPDDHLRHQHQHHQYQGQIGPPTNGYPDRQPPTRPVLRGGGRGGAGYHGRGHHAGTDRPGLPPRGDPVRFTTGQPERGQRQGGPEERESLRDSEEPFVDGNYFFNHLVKERAAENYNVAAVLRERDRDRRKVTHFRGRAAFTAVGAGRNVDRLSTSLPVGGTARPPGYYYYHPRVAAHDAHLGLPVLDMGPPAVSTTMGGDPDGHLKMPGEVHFADGLEIEIPPRRHAGLGGGGMRRALRESLSADHLLMVPDSGHGQVERAARFGRGYFRPAESAANLKPPLSNQQPTSTSSVVASSEQGGRSTRPEQSRVVHSARPLHTTKEQQEQPDDGRSGVAASRHQQQAIQSRESTPPPSRSPSPPPLSQQPVFNSYNVRTGRFQPDPEMQLPPPKPPPKLGGAPPPHHARGHVNLGVELTDDEDDEEGSSEMVGWRQRPNNSYGGQYRIRDEQASSNEWGDSRRRVIVPQPSPHLTKFMSTANVRAQQPYGVDGALRGHPPDPRLSVSWDPALSAHDTHVQRPRFRESRFPRDQAVRRPDPGGEVGNRKVVRWEDQAERVVVPQQVMPRVATEPGSEVTVEDEGGFHDNPAFAVEPSDANNTSNNNSANNTTASSTDNTGSFSREGLSYPINLSLSRSLLINDLENVDQFALFEVSTSKLCWAESFTGASWLDKTKQYKFVVLNRQEEVLFIGTEDDGAISNCIISPHKSSFKVRILDANGQDVIHFRRLYPVKNKTNFAYGQKNKYRLEVVTPSGHVIGNVEKTYDSDTYYILEDRAGECLFLVQRSCICTCPLFWDYEFKILLPDNEEEVGDISWSYLTCQNEQFNGTEISFPIELNATSKIMLLGVCFLLNFSRWQSSYLDSLYNPLRRRGKGTTESRAGPRVNQEVDALLTTSPGDGEGSPGAPGGHHHHPATVRNVVTGSGTR